MDTFSYFGMKPNKIIFPDGSSFRYRVAPTRVFLEAGEPEIEPDPVLANNTWEVIKAVCQSGQAANWWALGDAKNIAVSDVGDVPHAIVDMTEGRYEYADDSGRSSNVVFQAVPTIGSYKFNLETNTSPNGDGAFNGWDYSDLRASMNSGAIYGMYDSEFTALLEQVKTMAAYSGNTNTLVYSSDKLFIPAAREVKADFPHVQPVEVNSEQTEYGYYALNDDSNANRIKYPFGSSSVTYWWLRSPRPSQVAYVRIVFDIGTVNGMYSYDNYGVAPCFAF